MDTACLIYFTDTINVLRTCLQRPDIAEENEWKRCKNLTEESIDALDALMATSLSRFERQKCQTCMAHLLSIDAQLDSRLPQSRQGSGLEQRQDKEMVRWRDLNSAFQSRVKTGVIINITHKDINSFMRDAQILFEQKMQLALEEYDALKVNAELSAEYVIEKNDQSDDDVSIKYFNTKNESIFQSTDLAEWFEINIRQPIEKEMEEFEEKDSGWSLKSILNLMININNYNPLRGSSFIPLPESIKKKNACINVKNDDDECFKWAVLSALHPVSIHAERLQKYKEYENELNFQGIQFPVSFKQIKKFETQNDISINVLLLKKCGKNFEVTTGCVTSKKRGKHVNLLLIQDHYSDESKDTDDDDVDEQLDTPKFHYVWIKNLSRLIRSQVSKYKSKTFVCDRCLHCFWSEDKLLKHELDCIKINKCKIKLPSNDEKILRFENFERKERVPYVIYADIESLLKPIENGNAFQEHQAYSIGYYLKCSFNDARSAYKFYRQEKEGDPTPAEWFVKELDALSIELEVIHKQPEAMRLTDLEMLAFVRATRCHICKKPFEDDSLKVRDHSHLTGQ